MVDTDSGLYYGNRALKMSRSQGLKYLEANTLVNISTNYFNLKNFDLVLEYNQQAIKIYDELGRLDKKIDPLNNLGLLYDQLGQWEIALDYYYQALDVSKEVNDLRGESLLSTNIGSQYLNRDNYTQAYEYYIRALEIDESLNDSSALPYSYNNLALIYKKNKEYDKEIDFLKKALAISVNTINNHSLGLNQINIATSYLNQGDLDSALFYARSSFDTYSALKDIEGKAKSNYYLAKIYKELKSYDKALSKLEDAIMQANKAGFNPLLYDCFELLSQLYEVKGDYKNSLKAHQKALAFYDSVFNENREQIVAQLELNRNRNEKNELMLKNQLQESELEKQELIINRNNVYIILISIAAASLLFSLIYMVRSRKKKAALASLLASKNQEINELNLDLQKNVEALKAKIEEIRMMQKELIDKEKLASIGYLASGLGHEINNPLNFIHKGNEILANKLSKIHGEKHDMAYEIEIIETGVRRIEKITQKLIAFSSHNLSQKNRTDIKEVIYQALKEVEKKSSVAIKAEYGSVPIYVMGDFNALKIAFINIIQNSIDACDKEGVVTIEVQMEDQNQKARLKICDNGRGIPEDQIARLGDPFYTTKEETGAGLGLYIAFDTLYRHNMSHLISSKLQEGTCVEVNLSLMTEKYESQSVIR